jgi:HK97 family phage portal protein
MIPVPAERVGVRRAREGEAVPRGRIIYEIGQERFSPYDLLHVKGPCEPSALRGMGVLENHLATLELSAELAKQAKSSSGAGIPTGVLRSTNPDADTNALRALKTGWMAAQASRTVAVLNASTEFTPLAWKPTDAQLVESRLFSLHEIALLFGLDPSWLGAAQASRTYSNLGEESLNLLKYSLGGWLIRFEQTLSLAVPPGQRVQANLDALLRSDAKTRYQAHHSGISAGWLRRSEVRQMEDLPPVDGIDDLPLPGMPQSGGE